MGRNSFLLGCLLAGVITFGCGRTGSADRTAGNTGQVEIPAKTDLYLQLDRDVDSAKAKVGDTVAARLASPVVIDGKDAIPKGTTFHLRVTNSQLAREKGQVGLVTLEVDSFSLNGQKHPIHATELTASTKPLPSDIDPKALVPHMPLRQDQMQANAHLMKDRILPFETTDPVRFNP